jgi:hypothetical protein
MPLTPPCSSLCQVNSVKLFQQGWSSKGILVRVRRKRNAGLLAFLACSVTEQPAAQAAAPTDRRRGVLGSDVMVPLLHLTIGQWRWRSGGYRMSEVTCRAMQGVTWEAVGACRGFQRFPPQVASTVLFAVFTKWVQRTQADFLTFSPTGTWIYLKGNGLEITSWMHMNEKQIDGEI